MGSYDDIVRQGLSAAPYVASAFGLAAVLMFGALLALIKQRQQLSRALTAIRTGSHGKKNHS